ncbi:MAG: tRNA lysidine(34) synthetase TilS [Clostridia bacterium]
MSNRKNKDDDVINIIQKTIIDNELILDNEKILVALSGGPDSMCLLYSLLKIQEKLKKNIDFTIEAVHVHHMLRKESDAEEKDVEEYCKQNNVKLHIGKFDVKKIALEKKESVETAARNVRYEFFDQVAEKTGANKIAVAHNLNDDAETIIMHFIRGTSLNGLTGISYENRNIIRPLLNVTKEKVLEFCSYNNIKFAHDKTNDEQIYIRNKVRLDLIKKIEDEYNPNFISSVIRMKNILQEEELYLKEVSDKILEKVIVSTNINSIIFDRIKLNENNPAIVKRVLIALIQRVTGRLDGIEYIHINDVQRLIKTAVKGKKYILGNKYTVEIVDKSYAKISKN